MSRNSYDFNFSECLKPCNEAAGGTGDCIDRAPKRCEFYRMCDLEHKWPPKPPTIDWRRVRCIPQVLSPSATA